MNGTQQRLPKGEQVNDLLDDPIVQTLMRRDGVTREEVLAVIDEMRDRLFGRGRSVRVDAPCKRSSAIRLAA
ncbi:MAG: hypothetical protein WCF85_21000 [Rhodospirillaceae bacterium]